MGKIIENIEGIFIGLIGRPILIFIKWFRWMFLLAGIYFNTSSSYDPVLNKTVNSFTIIPFIIGLILFSIGLTIKRYDNAFRENVELDDHFGVNK